MKKLLAISFVSIITGCATSSANLPTQTNVDLNKYMGTWHEQARLPNRFQKNCVSDVQAEYKTLPDGTVSVTNQCKLEDGSTNVADGVARFSMDGPSADPAKLEVRFAPEWMSWLPLVWGDYWILKLEGDYEYSLVGTPNREYLWVLSRDKEADQAVVQSLLEHARSLGFQVEDVLMSCCK